MLRALWVFAPDGPANPSSSANTHLQRLLWSYNNSLLLEWRCVSSLKTVLKHGAHLESPTCTTYDHPFYLAASERHETILYAVAFVEEGAIAALPPNSEVTATALQAAHLVIITPRSRNRSQRALSYDVAKLAEQERLMHSSTTRVRAPLTLDQFARLCARHFTGVFKPAPRRFEFHTLDILRDIWGGIDNAGDHYEPLWTPAPRKRYTLDEALDPHRCEALVVTRRCEPFCLVFGNHAFWRAVGWPRNTQRGKNMSFLQGELTNREVAAAMQRELVREVTATTRGEEEGDDDDDGGATTEPEVAVDAWEVRASLINYTSEGVPFTNHLRISSCLDADLFVGHIIVVAAEEPPRRLLSADDADDVDQPVDEAPVLAAGSGGGDKVVVSAAGVVVELPVESMAEAGGERAAPTAVEDDGSAPRRPPPAPAPAPRRALRSRPPPPPRDKGARCANRPKAPAPVSAAAPPLPVVDYSAPSTEAKGGGARLTNPPSLFAAYEGTMGIVG